MLKMRIKRASILLLLICVSCTPKISGSLTMEQYVVKYDRLPEQVTSLMTTTFEEMGVKCPVDIKAKMGNVNWHFWFDDYRPPTWARGGERIIYFDYGRMNTQEGLRLWTPYGWSVLSHEAYHIYQADREGWLKWRLILVGNFFRSISNWEYDYRHEFIPIEIEATKFMNKVEQKWRARKDQLNIFREWRFLEDGS